ncbi:MAG: hypothetical protein QME96_14035, partial [Myxococcota bacterium]|nr:hypothetical protein [Myxococcota bacterium]
MSVAIAVWMAGAPARADAPAAIPLQGTLAEADGRPVHGIHAPRFAIHDSETGGTPLFYYFPSASRGATNSRRARAL